MGVFLSIRRKVIRRPAGTDKHAKCFLRANEPRFRAEQHSKLTFLTCCPQQYMKADARSFRIPEVLRAQCFSGFFLSNEFA